MSDRPDITRILGRMGDGDHEAISELMPVVYDELRRIARIQLGKSARNSTIQTTVLVHEAFLKLAGSKNLQVADRMHFFAVAATVMRQVLVDHARSRGAAKRGGDWERVDFESAVLDVEAQADLIVEIDDALTKLSELNARLTRVVECRFFAGLSVEETAQALDVTARTVHRDWVKARAWLHTELGMA
jgi:RNA polymerase sigma factor (TIGR02999 family)